MRLYFNLTPNTEVVPFDYQKFLIGCFHKWMGWNEYHDRLSLYSLSWLKNGKKAQNGFNFPDGATWFISFWDENIGKRLIKSAMNQPEVCCGMVVTDIQIRENPTFRERERFLLSSPVFIRKYDENKKALHLTYKNDDADRYLTEALIKKLEAAGLNANVKVSFDKQYQNPKTKLVSINEIKNRASLCPVIIEGDQEAIQFAWSVGVGHSTGCCFGALN